MRLTDLAEGNKKKDQPVKARDPNWRDMEALRKSGAAGSHGDKTKTIPRKEKYKNISMDEAFAQYMAEVDPAELGPMNDKMRDVLGKVHADDQAKEKEKQNDLERKAQEAEKDRQRLAAELGDEGMQDYISKLKSHDWFYAYSDDHRYYTKGSEEWKEISRLQKILDPKHEVYNKYAPDMMKSVKTEESVEEAHGNDKMYDKCWDGYKKVPGKKRGEKGSCVKERASVMSVLDALDESATAGATSAGNIASVANPHVAIGDKKARKDYGIRGKQPNPPKAKPIKPTDNALDMKGTSIFGGTLRRT